MLTNGSNTPNTIRMVNDPSMRASLLKQYTKIIDQAKFDLNKILITASSIVKQDSQRELDGFMAEVWLEERRLPENDHLSTSMVQLIEKRQVNVVDCIRAIYAQKLQFFLKTPTVIMREFFREWCISLNVVIFESHPRRSPAYVSSKLCVVDIAFTNDGRTWS